MVELVGVEGYALPFAGEFPTQVLSVMGFMQVMSTRRITRYVNGNRIVPDDV
jgi:hypothetical protein